MSYRNTSPLRRKAPIGAVIGTALNIGSKLGAMMPDTEGGDAIKGIVDPLANLSSSIDYFSQGKIGKGFFSLIPGVGTYLSGRDARKEEAELAKLEKEKASKAFFNSAKVNDAVTLDAIGDGVTRNSLYTPNGSTINNRLLSSVNSPENSISYSYGDNANNPVVASNAVPISPDAKVITNPDGTTSGIHETGNNVPITSADGKPIVDAEPGEVMVNSPDGKTDILSKRLGLAQAFEAVTQKINGLQTRIQVEKDPIQANAMNRELTALNKEKEELVKQQRIISSILEQQNPTPNDGIVGAVDSQTPQAPNGVYFDRDALYKSIPNKNRIVSDINNAIGNTGSFTKSFNSHVGDLAAPVSQDIIPKFDYDSLTGGKETFKDFLKDISLEKGLDIANQGLNRVLPIVSNLQTKRNLRNAAKMIAEQEIVPNKINTFTPKLDVSADENAINSTYANNLKLAEMNASPMTRAYYASIAGANRLSNLNQLHQQENNFNTQAKVNNVANANNVINANIDKLNALNAAKTESRVGLELSNIDARNATVNSLYKITQESNLKDRDKLTIELAIKELNENGVISRNLLDQLKTLGIDLSTLQTSAR